MYVGNKKICDSTYMRSGIALTYWKLRQTYRKIYIAEEKWR